MNCSHLISLAAGLLCASLSAVSQPAENRIPGDPVRIDSGLLSGKLLSGGVKAYLGIPYAAPPVGSLRWRAPQPVKAWTGVRPAVQHGAPCPQRGPVREGMPAYSEDCLFLNVWAPASPPASKLPVIFYIYGGGYQSGSSSAPVLSGEFLAAKGVVYVNFNYRLGVLGNLALPELTAESPHKASSNYVHLDEIAVLQWVHRNIANFGGDPGNVTLMGQSSGGMDVCYLQGSSLSRGLIHRVFAMSGSTFPGGPWTPRPLKDVEKAGLQFMEKLGVKSLTELRAVPWDKLLETSWIDISEPTAADGYVLPQPTPEAFAANRQTKVPAMLEWCRDEVFSGLTTVRTLGEYNAAVDRAAGPKAGELLRLYPASNDDEARQAGLKAGRAGATAKQMVGWAVAQAAANSPAYVSVFSYGQSAGHSRDVAYWHGTMNQAAGPAGRGAAVTAWDRELSDRMMDALIAFARTGNPNTAQVKWPVFDPKDPHRVEFGDHIEIVPLDRGVLFYIANPDVRVNFRDGGRGGPGGPQIPGRRAP